MIRCLIVDDEEPARELIRLHLSGLKDFEVVGMVDNSLDAFSWLQKNQADLVFLDIKMPGMSGLELLRSLKQMPTTILVTAYRDYAAEAFELDVFDYLVKPVTQERFMKVIAKFMQALNKYIAQKATGKANDDAYLFLKMGRDQVKIMLNDILYVEGLSDYVKVHITGKYFIASETLAYMEAQFPSHSFARIHKSYIVSLNKITSYNSEQVVVKGMTLPLGRFYKAAFIKAVRGNSADT